MIIYSALTYGETNEEVYQTSRKKRDARHKEERNQPQALALALEGTPNAPNPKKGRRVLRNQEPVGNQRSQSFGEVKIRPSAKEV
jgi:hypothetical protein